MDASEKFVWAFLIENGRVTNGDWSYYGGSFEHAGKVSFTQLGQAEKEMREAILEIGVDWSKTKMPAGGLESRFEGTFTEASSVETLLGTLVLLDGSTYVVGCVDDEGFSDYITKLAKLAQDKQRVKDILGEDI